MTDSEADRRREADRRVSGERRTGANRRRTKGRRGFLLRLLRDERRQLEERRRGWDRRTGVERRSSRQTATDLVRSAFDLLVEVFDTDDLDLDDEARHQLDAAMIRLKFALERLAKE